MEKQNRDRTRGDVERLVHMMSKINKGVIISPYDLKSVLQILAHSIQIQI
jgi:hypothetical protein